MSASAPARRRKHHEEPEEHENHERWLVSYADMITVLMALFIVMFAISNVDQSKFDALRSSLASSFGNPIVPLSGGPSAVETTPLVPGPFDIGPKVTAEKEGEAKSAADAQERARADARRKAAQRELDRLEEARRKILAALRAKRLQDSVRFRYDERGLIVSVITDDVVFAPDRAELQRGGRIVIDAIAPVLRQLPNNLSVEGHTNLVPVDPKYFPTEWELSTARAVAVVRHLTEKDRVAAKRLTASGFADQRPLVPGTGRTANRVNRRVEIVVLSTLAPGERALLPKLAPATPATAG